MSKPINNNTDDQEIDLAQISRKAVSFIQGIKMAIFNYIQFFIKNRIVIAILFLVGLGIGIYLDSTSKTYEHQIIVMPNFESTDYLYSKIDLIESKIKERDTIFLKSIGIAKPSNLISIEINPIVDIYNFVNNDKKDKNTENSQNFELVKLLAESGDINKIIKDKLTSKNYSRHSINIVTKGFVSEENTINPLLKYLNQNDYFNKVRLMVTNNIVLKIKKNEEIIAQIDNLLNEFSSTVNNNQKSDKLVYYNENSQINEIILSKNNFISDIGKKRTDLIDFESVIKKISSVINVKNTNNINGKLKFVLPLLLIFGFILFGFFRRFYNKQKTLSELNQ